MTETENPPQKLQSQSTATGLGALLVFGLLLATGFAVYEHANRRSIERVDFSNAVGDKAVYPATFNRDQPLLNYDGHSFYFVSNTNPADAQMMRIGMDDSKVYSIYKPASGPGANDAAFIYLKLGTNSYIQAQRR